MKIVECVKKYLEDEGFDHPEFASTVMDEFPDEPAYKKCKSTLNCSAKLEALVLTHFLISSFVFKIFFQQFSNKDLVLDVSGSNQSKGTCGKMGAATWKISTLLLSMVRVC